MRYVIIDAVNGDIFNEEYNEKEKALQAAAKAWSCLSTYDKNRREAFYVLESIDPDENSERHFDGDIIKAYK